jgi:WD40 repeat protein
MDPYYTWLGIPPEERPINHYRLLGLSLFEQDQTVIANAADQRMAFLKTFQTGPHGRLSQDLLNEAARARICLLNPDKKSQYDADLRAVLKPNVGVVAEDAPAPTSEIKSKKYYFARQGRSFGPFSSDELRQFAIAGTLLPDDLVMKQGHGGWTVARQLAGLSNLFQVPVQRDDPAPHEDPAPTAPPVWATTEHPDRATSASHAASTVPSSGEIPNIRSPRPRTRRAKKSLPVAVWGVAIACVIMSGIVAALKPSTDNFQRDVASAVAAAQPSSESAKPPVQPLDSAEPPSAVPPSAAPRSAESPSKPRDTSQRESAEPDHGQTNPPPAESGATDPPADPSTNPPATHSTGAATVAVKPRVTVTVNGRPQSAASSDESASDSDAKPVTTTSTPATAPATEDGIRLAVPSADSIAEAQRLAKELFAEDYAAAKTAESKRRLAAKLLSVAKDTHDDSAARFVLQEESTSAAVGGGDFDLAFEAIDELETRYQIDGLDRRVGVLTVVSRLLPKGETERFTELALDVVGALVDHDQYTEAIRLLKLLASRAKRDKQVDLVAKIARREKEITAFGVRFEGARAVREVLEKQPDDAQANRIFGEYLCLVKDDWASGCHHLARGDRPALKAAAESELAGPAETDAQVALGDAWWALADEYEDTEAEQVRRRAVFWYDICLPRLSGLSKVRVEKRVAEVALAPAESAKRPSRVHRAPAAPAVSREAWKKFVATAKWVSLLGSEAEFRRHWKQGDKGGSVFFDQQNHSLDITSFYELGSLNYEGSWRTCYFQFEISDLSFGNLDIRLNDHAMTLGDIIGKSRGRFDVVLQFSAKNGTLTAHVVDFSSLSMASRSVTVVSKDLQNWAKFFHCTFRSDGGGRAKLKILKADLTEETYSHNPRDARASGADSQVPKAPVAATAPESAIGEVRCFRGHDRAVWSVAVAKLGQTAYSVGGDDTLREWDLSPTSPGDGRVVESNVKQPVTSSPDGNVIVFGSNSGTMRLLRLDRPNTAPESFGEAGASAFSADGKWLAVVTSSGLTVWSLDGAHPEETARFKNSLRWSGASIAYSRDNLLAVGLYGEKTTPVDIPVFRVNETSVDNLMALSGHINSVRRVVFSPDGTLLASAGWDGAIRIWNMKSKKVMREAQHVQAPPGVMTGVAFSPSGKRMLVCGGTWNPGNGLIRLLDARTGKQIAQFDGHTTVVSQVVFTPDGTMAVSGAEDSTVRLWKLPPE